MRWIVVASMSAWVAGCGQSATKFDLMCTQVIPSGDQTGVAPLKSRYVMDLGRMRYCEVDDCPHGQSVIEKVTDDEIIADDGKTFLRHDARLVWKLGAITLIFDCKKARYSGMPKAAF